MMKLGNRSSHKPTETPLSLSELNMKTVLEYAFEAVLVIKAGGRLIYANKKASEITGCKSEELMGKNLKSLDFFPDSYLQQIDGLLAQGLTGQSTGPSEFELKKINGTGTRIEFYSNIVQQDENTLITVFFHDITGRKKAEEVLRGSEEKFRNLFVHAKDAVILADTETGILVDVNPAGCKLLGLPKDKIVGMHQTEMHPPEMAEKYKQVFREYVEKGIVVNDDMVIRRANGTQVQVELSASVIKLAGKKLIQWVLRNVTERKQMEKTLRESEEKFSAAFRASPNAISITTLKDGVFLDVNESFVRDHGYTREEIIGHSSKELKIWAKPEERDRILHILRECGQAENEEYSSRTKYGEIRTMLLSAEPINIAGEPCIIAVTTDITERKQAEKALKESEQKFSAAFRASPSAISITTLKDGIFLDVNDSFTRINGYTREEVIGRSSKELKIWVEPGERDRILHALREHGRAVNEEYSSRTKSGQIRTMLLSAEPINIAGESCIIAVTTDITERKQTENEFWVQGGGLEELVPECSSGLADINQRLKYKLEGQEKFEQALRKASIDIEMANRANS